MQTARTAQQLGIPMPTGDNTHANAEGGAGLTKEQRFKMGEREHEAGEANAQFDRLLKHPAVTNSGDLGNAAVGMLPSAVTQRVAPGVAKQVQDVNEVNTQLIQQLGKVSKDADGKPNKETLKMFHDRFEIHSGDTPAIRAQKVEGVRNIVNSLLRAEGARSAPVPNDPSRGKAANDNDDPYAKYRVGGR